MVTLKEQKELFVSGHDGTTPWEILLVCSAAPIGIWLFQGLQQQHEQARQRKASLLLEALVLWGPFVICQTKWLYPWGVGILVLELLLAAGLLFFQSSQAQQSTRTDANDHRLLLMKDVMTVYRSSLLYMTFVAILAVDFHVFPRRFAKTEVAGFGLMDLGAGSFVVAAGLVSPRARRQMSTGTGSSATSLHRHVRRILPLVLLGFLRLATNKGLEYQEHVSEYGVHWNFFFTLAMIAPLGSVLPGQPTWTLPLVLLAGYQCALSLGGWQTFIEHGSRTECFLPGWAQPPHDNNNISSNGAALQLCTLLAANREGVLGCLGYLVLYLASEYIAFRFLWNKSNNKSSLLMPWALLTASLWGVLALLVQGLGIPVSRRSTNASFCVWTLAHNLVLVLGIRLAMGSHRGRKEASVPVVLEAVNRHGFLAFLVANVLTGLINLTMNTLAVDDFVALIIVFAYLCAVGTVALFMNLAIMTRSERRDQDKNKKEE